jgi:hypothetical protein
MIMLLELAVGNIKNLKPGSLVETKGITSFFYGVRKENMFTASKVVSTPAKTVMMYLGYSYQFPATRRGPGTYHFRFLFEDRIVIVNVTNYRAPLSLEQEWNAEIEAIRLLNDLFEYAQPYNKKRAY